MSTSNLSAVLKSCSEGELGNEVMETMTSNNKEGSRLKRTFTLPRNPFGTVKTVSKSKPSSAESKVCNGEATIAEAPREEGGLERKLFRRPSWKRFINRIAQHMTSVNTQGVSS